MKEITGEEIKPKYEEVRKLDVPVNVLNVDLVEKVFNWKPSTDLETGIKKTYNYIKDYY